MSSFLRNLVMCAAAGILLTVVFLTPASAAVGAINGLIVGLCMCLAEWRAQRAEADLAPGRIKLVGNH